VTAAPPDTSTAANRGAADELVPGRLYRVGGMVPLDGRVSWMPADVRGYQPSNAYVLAGAGEPLLVDTGLAYHEELVLRQLACIVPPDREVKVFLTRGEMDCVSNLGAISARFGVSELHTGGVTNPFDAFDDVAVMRQRDRRRQVEQKGSGGSSVARTPIIELTPGRRLEIESPMLRLLPTFWGWDEATRTLFTSDVFAHTFVAHADDPAVIDESIEDATTAASAAAGLYAKYEWLPRAQTEAIRAYVEETFARRRPEIVAPTRGCVLKGRAVIERHLAFVLDALGR